MKQKKKRKEKTETTTSSSSSRNCECAFLLFFFLLRRSRSRLLSLSFVCRCYSMLERMCVCCRSLRYVSFFNAWYASGGGGGDHIYMFSRTTLSYILWLVRHHTHTNSHLLTLCVFCYICDCPSHDLLCYFCLFRPGDSRTSVYSERLSRWQYNKTMYCSTENDRFYYDFRVKKTLSVLSMSMAIDDLEQKEHNTRNRLKKLLLVLFVFGNSLSLPSHSPSCNAPFWSLFVSV